MKRYLSIILERIGSLKDMLEELFTFTRLKNGDYHMELEEIYVNRILKDCIFSYYEDWCNKGIQLEISITEEPLVALGNEQAFRRVVQNIVKKRIDHGERKIMISLEKDRDGIVIKIGNLVRDPEKIDTERVFERFYKIDESRSRNSTGLGLSIAKEFVVQMGGRIEAYVQEKVFGIRICL